MKKGMLLSPSMPNPCHISEFTSSQSSSYTASGRKRKLLAAHPAHHVAPIIAASLSSPASMTAPCPLPMTPAERTTQMEKTFPEHPVHEPQSLSRRSHPKFAFPFIYPQGNTQSQPNYPSCFSGYTSFTLYVRR